MNNNNKLILACINNQNLNLSDLEQRNIKKFQRNNKNFSDLLSQFIEYNPPPS